MRIAHELIRQIGVVLLQHALGVGVGVGKADGRVRLCKHEKQVNACKGVVARFEWLVLTARLRVGRVVDACDPHTKGDRESGALRGHGHLVEDDGLEVACARAAGWVSGGGRGCEVWKAAAHPGSRPSRRGRGTSSAQPTAQRAVGAQCAGTDGHGRARARAARRSLSLLKLVAVAVVGLKGRVRVGRRRRARARATCGEGGEGGAREGGPKARLDGRAGVPAGRWPWSRRPRAAPRWRGSP